MPYVVTSSGTDGKQETEAKSLKEAIRIGDEVQKQGRTNVEVINLQGDKWPLRYAKMQLGSISVRSV